MYISQLTEDSSLIGAQRLHLLFDHRGAIICSIMVGCLPGPQIEVSFHANPTDHACSQRRVVAPAKAMRAPDAPAVAPNSVLAPRVAARWHS